MTSKSSHETEQWGLLWLFHVLTTQQKIEQQLGRKKQFDPKQSIVSDLSAAGALIERRRTVDEIAK